MAWAYCKLYSTRCLGDSYKICVSAHTIIIIVEVLLCKEYRSISFPFRPGLSNNGSSESTDPGLLNMIAHIGDVGLYIGYT